MGQGGGGGANFDRVTFTLSFLDHLYVNEMQLPHTEYSPNLPIL